MAIRPRGNGLEVAVQVTVDGEKRRYRETIHTDMVQARAFEIVVHNALMHGREVKPFKAGGPGADFLTLSAALDATYARYWAGGGQEESVRANIKSAIEFFGADRDIAGITSADMDDYVQTLREDDYAVSTIRQKVGVVTKMLHYQQLRGYLRAVPRVELPKPVPNERQRVIDDDEFQRILENCKDAPEFAALWTLLHDTGARPSELRRVKTSDLRGDLLTLAHTKTGKPRTIPLTKRSLEAFTWMADKVSTGKPFAWATKDTIRHGWARHRRAMDLMDDDGFIPYALRHTCATKLYAKTLNIRLVKDWMGHEDFDMTLRYAKLQPSAMQDARDLLTT